MRARLGAAKAWAWSPAAAALVASGVLLGLTTLLAETFVLLRPGSAIAPGLGASQLMALGASWLLIAHGVERIRSPYSHGDILAARLLPARDRLVELAKLGAIAAQLGVLVVVFQRFALETPAFHDMLAPLVIVGFILHELTPAPYRMAFFVALSASATYLLMGWHDASWLIVLGVGLVALCHLPIPFYARVALIIAAGAGLAALRSGSAALPWSAAVWPVLGSMFMFRMVSYLYDLRHGKVAPGTAHRLGYFFLLPNIVFPLFPVVDYSAYRRGYYDTDRKRIYLKGVDWMVRGTVQLLLYRLVYQEFTIGATEVSTWDQLARHVLSTFLLYLRVSGQFHLIVGILHLFGLNLPETHNRYLLSSSFTDFWRRINIYWKDFMMKVVYYPTFFSVRRHGGTTAMVIATLSVFLATWALHSYQWFWLLGTFPVTWTDGLFWGALGGILVVDSLREAKRGRHRSLGERTTTFAEVVRRGLRVGATFVVISLLWSLWMSPSVSAWLALWKNATGFSPDWGERLMPVALIGGMAIYGIGSSRMQRWRSATPSRAPFATAAVIVLLWGAAMAPMDRLPPRAAQVAGALSSEGLNTGDMAMLTRGYYEDLTNVSRFNSQLWEVYTRRSPDERWPMIWLTAAGRTLDGYLKHELNPSARIVSHGTWFTTNRWAMRDRDYTATPQDGTLRIALLGASIEMGWGVPDDSTFEALLEARLNSDSGRDGAMEILNFAVADYKLVTQLVLLDRVLTFEPDVVMLATHEVDMQEAITGIIERAEAGYPPPFEWLRRVAAEAGLGIDPFAEVRPRLEARSGEIERWIYEEFAVRCRERGITPVWLFVPFAGEPASPARVREMERLAEEVGLATMNLSAAFANVDPGSVRLAEYDLHPNTTGHRILAERLHSDFSGHPDIMAAVLNIPPANEERR